MKYILVGEAALWGGSDGVEGGSKGVMAATGAASCLRCSTCCDRLSRRPTRHEGTGARLPQGRLVHVHYVGACGVMECR